MWRMLSTEWTWLSEITCVKNLESKNLWGMDFCQILWKVYKYLRLNGDFHVLNGSRVNKVTDYTSHSEISSISIDQNNFMGEERNCGALLWVLDLMYGRSLI